MSNEFALGPLVLAAALIAGCTEPTPVVEYEIVSSYPHDTLAYTQGLLFHDGFLYESTGQYGSSTLRKVDVPTGSVVASTPVDSAYFAEGLALVGSELIQLTWKAGIALVYDLETLEFKRNHQYSGEGWGLCFDGESLFMSDGSSTLFERDPDTFEVRSEVAVTENGFIVPQLNELECVGDRIYANVFQSDRIVQIEKASGEVTASIDGFQLGLLGRRPDDVDAVLNGIAYIPEAGIFLMTGKLWPNLLAVKLANELDEG